MNVKSVDELCSSFDHIIRSIAGDVNSLKQLASVRYDVEEAEASSQNRDPSSLPFALSEISSLVSSLASRCDDLAAVIEEEKAAELSLVASRDESLTLLAAVEALRAQAPDGKMASLCKGSRLPSAAPVPAPSTAAPATTAIPPAPAAARLSLGPTAPAPPKVFSNSTSSSSSSSTSHSSSSALQPPQPRPILEAEYGRLPLSIRSRLSYPSLYAAHREVFALQQLSGGGPSAAAAVGGGKVSATGVAASEVRSRCDFFKGGEAHGNLVISALRQLNRIKTKGTLTLNNNENCIYFVSA